MELQKEKKLITITILVLVILAALYLLLAIKGAKTDSPSEVNEEKNEVIVENSLESATTADETVPAGFPKSIPIETGNIIESFKSTYSGAGLTQYTLSYKSAKNRNVKWTEYYDFMKVSYSLVAGSTSKANGTIYGLRGDSGLLVTVTDSQDGGSTV